MKKALLLTTVAAIAAGATALRASTVSYDANVTMPPGVFFGTGNTNGAFTVVTDSTDGIELGLRAKLAVVSPPLDPVSTNNYVVPVGAEPGSPTRAAWGVDYSINVANSSNSLTGYIAELTVTDLTTSTTLTTWDALGNSSLAIPKVTDDSYATSTAFSHTGGTIGATDVVAQNSENAAFFSGLNFNSLDNYSVTLTLFTNSAGTPGSQLATDTINVDVAPLPSAATMGLGMLALIGAAGMIRSKLRTA